MRCSFLICYFLMILWFFPTFRGPITYLSWLLMRFEAILGLKINLKKSELTPIHRVVNAWELVFIWEAIWGYFHPQTSPSFECLI